MQPPLISVIIPVFNAELTLWDTYNSVANQTHSNLEIIIVDDGSKDKSKQIISEISSRDSRVKVIVQPNLGLAKTLNVGIDAASGEYIARIDADDICNKLRFESQLSFMLKYDVDICGSWMQLFPKLFFRKWKNPIFDQDIRLALAYYNCLVHPSIIARREVFEEFKYEDIGPAQDYNLWCKIAERSNFKFGNVPEYLINYRLHNHQITSKSGMIQKKNAASIRNQYRMNCYKNAPSLCSDEDFSFKDIISFVRQLKTYSNGLGISNLAVHCIVKSTVARKAESPFKQHCTNVLIDCLFMLNQWVRK